MNPSSVPFLSRPTFYYDRKAALLAGLYGAAMGILPVLAAKYFAASKMQIALLSSAPVAAYLLTLYWGHFARQRRKLPLVVVAWALARGLFLVVGLLSHLWPIIVLACLSYLINAAALPAYSAIWRHNYPTEVRGRLVGRVIRSNILVVAAGTLLFGWLLDQDPRLYRVIFPLAGALGVAAALVFRRVRVRRDFPAREQDRERFHLGRALGVVLRNRTFGKYLLAFFISGFGNLMAQPMLVVFLNEHFEATYQEQALVRFLPLVLQLVLLPFWGRVADRVNPMVLRAVLGIFWGTSYLIWALAPDMMTVYGAQVLRGVAMGGGTITWLLGTMYFASKEDLPLYMGLHTTLTGVRGLVAPFVGAWIAGRIGAQPLFGISWLLGWLSAALMLLLARHVSRQARGQTERVHRDR